MKVLVIGASGMLAKPVVKKLVSEGFTPRLFSRNVKAEDFDEPHEIINGDVYNKTDLQNAIKDCVAIHISLNRVNESIAVSNIVEIAKNNNVQLISYVSGASVCKENTWFPMIENKWNAEQSIINSGIAYLIFRPGWFFETLKLMVKNGRASVIAKKPRPERGIAADDFANIIVNGYKNMKSWNNIFSVLGQEEHYMKDMLTAYCQKNYPDIKKVGSITPGVLKLIGKISRKKELCQVADMISYFEGIKEINENTLETYSVLGSPQLSFEKWLELQN